jgi:hypothetical protein
LVVCPAAGASSLFFLFFCQERECLLFFFFFFVRTRERLLPAKTLQRRSCAAKALLRRRSRGRTNKKASVFNFKRKIVLFYKTSYAIFFNFGHTKNQTQRQVCWPSAEIANKLVGYLNENFDKRIPLLKISTRPTDLSACSC